MSGLGGDRLAGITEGDYQAWRHHPVTKLLLQYMIDFREALTREATTAWIDGSLLLSDQKAQEARARIATLHELGDLPWGAIESFYKEGSENAGIVQE